jgi:hypothetical protein
VWQTQSHFKPTFGKYILNVHSPIAVNIRDRVFRSSREFQEGFNKDLRAHDFGCMWLAGQIGISALAGLEGSILAQDDGNKASFPHHTQSTRNTTRPHRCCSRRSSFAVRLGPGLVKYSTGMSLLPPHSISRPFFPSLCFNRRKSGLRLHIR